MSTTFSVGIFDVKERVPELRAPAPGYSLEVLTWDQDVDEWVIGRYLRRHDGSTAWVSGPTVLNVTHWMPLPPAPEKGSP